MCEGYRSGGFVGSGHRQSSGNTGAPNSQPRGLDPDALKVGIDLVSGLCHDGSNRQMGVLGETISLLNGDRAQRSALWAGLSKMFRVTPVTYGVHTHLAGSGSRPGGRGSRQDQQLASPNGG